MFRSLILALLCLVLTRAEETEVLVLTTDNFDAAIADNEFILVEFYAPWCGHCKALAPEFDKASLMLKEKGSNIKLGKVDATVESSLASKYSVQGYPTLKFFKSGTPVEYSGGRTSDTIVSWLIKKSGPALVEIKSKDDFEKAKKENQVVGIIVSTDKTAKVYEIIEKVAGINDAIPFMHTSDPSLVGLKDNTFTLFKQFDEPQVSYDGQLNVEDINTFIKAQRIALVTEFSQETSQVVFESEIKVHILAFLTKENIDEFNKYKAILTESAKNLIGKLHVLVLDLESADSMRVAEYFSIGKEAVPTYTVLNIANNMMKYFPEDKVFTAEAITKFANDVLAGKVKPHLKSQTEPEDWDKEDVKVLVANKFTERAINKDKSVFVEFYAPWCGHCKALTPIWEELAKKFKDDSSIVIAKMDSTENELESISVTGFPTLKYSPKGSIEFIDYKGGRTIEALEKFVKSDGKAVEEDADEEEGQHDEL